MEDLIKEIQKILDDHGFYKYDYKYCSHNIFTFERQEKSLIVIKNGENNTMVSQLKKKLSFKEASGYLIFMINRKLNNPFLDMENRLESSFYFDVHYKTAFDKIQYFINKVLQISKELQHYPVIEYDSFKTVTIKLKTHHANGITEKDIELSERITDIYSLIK